MNIYGKLQIIEAVGLDHEMSLSDLGSDTTQIHLYHHLFCLQSQQKKKKKKKKKKEHRGKCLLLVIQDF